MSTSNLYQSQILSHILLPFQNSDFPIVYLLKMYEEMTATSAANTSARIMETDWQTDFNER